MITELIWASAIDLASAIRQRQVSAVEVIQAHLDHIAAVNPALNAIVTLDEAGALLQARAADEALARGMSVGPLHGVPFTVKDALETTGILTTSGFPPLKKYQPAKDAPVVARLRGAGGILIGKTNLPLLTNDYQTSNPIFGRTNNPWGLERTPGGSSGGGAAAVAAGLTPLDLASDVGGSIRLPAHYCGVIGLKPTGNRTPMTGHIPPLPGNARGLRHLATIGLLARSIKDTWLGLRIIAGPDEVQSQVPPVPLADVTSLPSPLRIAWTACWPQAAIETELQQGIERLARNLAASGYVVEQTQPAGFDLFHACALYGELFAAELSSALPPEVVESETQKLGRAHASESSEPYTRGYAQGITATLRRYTALLHERDHLIRQIEQFLDQWDVWICPSGPTAAIAHCPPGTPIRINGQSWPYLAQGWVHLPFSLTHQPSITIPVGLTQEGLPYGVQLVGRRWAEASLFAIAEVIASAIPALPKPPHSY